MAVASEQMDSDAISSAVTASWTTEAATNTTELGNANSTVVCWNEYCWDLAEYDSNVRAYIFPNWYEWLFILFYFLTFLLGLTGNYLVCFVVWKNHNMRTVTNVFIVNLAVSDFLVILLCLPATLVQDVAETWFLGTAVCKILLYMINVSVSVSVLTLTAISVERYYAICHPLRFKSTLGRARTIIIGVWLVALGVALPEVIVSEAVPHPFPKPYTSHLLTSCRPTWLPLYQSIYQLVVAVVMYLLPLILMTATYANVAHVLWKNEIPGAAESVSGTRKITPKGRKPMLEDKAKNPEEKLQSRRKAAKMLITIVIFFFICYLPVHLLNILRYFGALHMMTDHSLLVQLLLSHWLPYLNSACNPIIYNFMSAKFRKEFKLAFYCCLRREVRRRGEPFTMTFSNSNYSNCHTEEVTLTSFRD